jgi:hypothetical protein
MSWVLKLKYYSVTAEHKRRLIAQAAVRHTKNEEQTTMPNPEQQLSTKVNIRFQNRPGPEQFENNN